eukprot:TRINITY_DN58451_c0_g1_i1.p1 TRINITY_DN58451_c0_g1~~TRINITY_DN58451_c0_g1_i1.p1  ORF type:complete len:557 (-),score=117.84 TRINITY_DN58451_c0_g1_i1:100-1770(-)
MTATGGYQEAASSGAAQLSEEAVGGAAKAAGTHTRNRPIPPLPGFGKADSASSQDLESALFETYKNCPQLAGALQYVQLPTKEEKLEDSALQKAGIDLQVGGLDPRTALESELLESAGSNRLLSLFRGTVSVAGIGEGIVCSRVPEPAAEAPVAGSSGCYLPCGACVISLVRTGAGWSSRDGGDELIVATLSGGHIVVVAVTAAAEAKVEQVVPAHELPWPSRGAGPLSRDAVAIVARRSASRVWVLLQRVWAKGKVEVLAVSVARHTADSSCDSPHKRVAALDGERPVRGACWCAVEEPSGSQLLLVAEAGFEVSACCDLAAAERAPLADSLGAAVVTSLCIPADADAAGSVPKATCWSLPAEGLLAAWPEAIRADDSVDEASQWRLAVLLPEAQSGGALLLGLSLPADADAGAAVPAATLRLRVPGLASLATARQQLRLVLASPARNFFALVEAMGQSAAVIFRRPSGSRAPTTAPPLMDDRLFDAEGNVEVLGAVLTDDFIDILTPRWLVRCPLDKSVALPGEKKRALPSRDEMPMGIDPAALLRMLDLQGED